MRTIPLLSAQGTTQLMSPPPHADRALPEDRSRSLRSSRSLQLRRCSPPPPSRRHPAPSSSRPPSPRGATLLFSGGGRGGVVVVVVIRVLAPHVVKDTPSVVFIRMGEDDRPSPTTTHHVLPLWRRRHDAVRRGQRRDRRHGGAAAGLGFFLGRRG